jgi:hypothetical protein
MWSLVEPRRGRKTRAHDHAATGSEAAPTLGLRNVKGPGALSALRGQSLLWVGRNRYAAPAMYLAKRPQLVQRNVMCALGGGGSWEGSRSIEPEHDGQLSGVPVRSFVMR